MVDHSQSPLHEIYYAHSSSIEACSCTNVLELYKGCKGKSYWNQVESNKPTKDTENTAKASQSYNLIKSVREGEDMGIYAAYSHDT